MNDIIIYGIIKHHMGKEYCRVEDVPVTQKESPIYELRKSRINFCHIIHWGDSSHEVVQLATALCNLASIVSEVFDMQVSVRMLQSDETEIGILQWGNLLLVQ